MLRGGPAAKAGLREGDVITALAGKEIETLEDFLGALRDVEPGQNVVLQARRAGTQLDITVVAGEIPS